jgi:uncharacterized protein (TIGR00369 family)
MEIRTHTKAQPRLLGTPVYIEENVRAEVELKTIQEMAVDDHGLVHGGFTFGLADYAAMLAINHPNVVLGASEVRFLAPVVVGDELVAVAEVLEDEGKRIKVEVVVSVNDKLVLKGVMTCHVLDHYVLDRNHSSK